MLIAGQFEFDGVAVNVEPYIIGDMMGGLWRRNANVVVGIGQSSSSTD
jgi:hypothetical protein